MNFLTLADRLKFLDSILDGTIKIKTGDVRTLSETGILDKACNAVEILQHLQGEVKRLDAGAYGTVYDLCLNRTCSESFIMKKIIFKNYDFGSLDNPLIAENVEISILKKLNELLLLGVTPHIPRYLGDAICEEKTEDYRVLFAEKADGDLHNFIVTKLINHLVNFTLEERRLIWKVIFFQIIYTLKVIYDRFPTFKHNDLHDKNILYFKTADFEPSLFEYIANNKSFFLPNIGYSIALWDFDMSSMTGILENYRVLVFDGDDGVTAEPNHYWDLHKIFNTILTNIISKYIEINPTMWHKIIPEELVDFLHRIIPFNLRGKSKPSEKDPWLVSKYLSLNVNLSYITPSKLLNDNYFDEFLSKANTQPILETYTDTLAKTDYQVPKIPKIPKIPKMPKVSKISTVPTTSDDINCKYYLKTPYFNYRDDQELTKQGWARRQECNSTKADKTVITLADYHRKMPLPQDKSGNSSIADVINNWLLLLLESRSVKNNTKHLPELKTIANKRTTNKTTKAEVLEITQKLIADFLSQVYVPIRYIQLLAYISLEKALFYLYHERLISTLQLARFTDNGYSMFEVIDFHAQFNMFLYKTGLEPYYLNKYAIYKLD